MKYHGFSPPWYRTLLPYWVPGVYLDHLLMVLLVQFLPQHICFIQNAELLDNWCKRKESDMSALPASRRLHKSLTSKDSKWLDCVGCARYSVFSYLVGEYRRALSDAIPHVDTLTNGGVWEERSRARRRSEWCSFGESHDRERVHSGNLHAQGWLGGSNSCLKIRKKL